MATKRQQQQTTRDTSDYGSEDELKALAERGAVIGEDVVFDGRRIYKRADYEKQPDAVEVVEPGESPGTTER